MAASRNRMRRPGGPADGACEIAGGGEGDGTADGAAVGRAVGGRDGLALATAELVGRGDGDGSAHAARVIAADQARKPRRESGTVSEEGGIDRGRSASMAARAA
jgi:hypothetical protein